MDHSKNLRTMVICLTLLFIFAQCSFFLIHMQAEELVDTLVNSSVSSSFFYPVILFPFVTFLFIQIIIYVIWASWILFVSMSLGVLFKLSARQTYWLGIVCWFMAAISVLTLNFYYYPDSFFSELFLQNILLQTISFPALICSVSILLLATALAYINYFFYGTHRFLGSVLLLVAASILVVSLYDKYTSIPITKSQASRKPNVIIIGLDSMRPDFTSFFGNKTLNTPNIDAFLNASQTFTEAYTPLARTFPSWMSILTAQYPKHNSVRNNLVDQSQIVRHDTLAKKLQLAGYETIYATDEKRFSNITKDFGFDHVVGPGMGVNDFLLAGLSDFPLTNLVINFSVGRILFPFNYGNRAAAITYEPNNFLRLLSLDLATRSDKPIFLAVHLCVSHWPFSWAHQGVAEKNILPERYRLAAMKVDAQLGDLLKILETNGLLNNSMVVLLSDHGTTVGLPHDRMVTKENYIGNKKFSKKIPIYRLATAPKHSLDFAKDYALHTSYGQATDVLSLKQYWVLLAFRNYTAKVKPKKIRGLVSLLDVSPTLLNLLDLPPLHAVDGQSLKTYFDVANHAYRPFFIETGDSLTEIETDHIDMMKVMQKKIGIYQVNPTTGLLSMSDPAEKSLINNKQRAVLSGDWLLARYPAGIRSKINASTKWKLVDEVVPPFFVLINMKTGKWTLELKSDFAKKAPVKAMQAQLKQFYGDEV